MKLNLLLATVLYLALRTGQPDVALVAGPLLAARVGFRAAVRKSGVGLVRTGSRRIVSGRL